MKKTTRVSVDRMEEGFAVLVTTSLESFMVPVELLPEDCREGDVLNVTFRRNPEETERLASRVRDLQERLLERTRKRKSGKENESG